MNDLPSMEGPGPEPTSAPTEAVAAVQPAEPKPKTLQDLRNDPLTRDVIYRLQGEVRDAEWARDQFRHSAGRARTEASNAKQLHERYQKALREGALELNAAGVRTTVDHLVNQPAELPSLVRRLAKTVREIGPDRDALRGEVRRLNGEILDHPKELAAKDAEISALKKQIDAGVQREKALEKTTEVMQKQRDAAQADLARSLKEQGRLEEQLKFAQGTIKTYQAEEAARMQKELTAQLRAPATAK